LHLDDTKTGGEAGNSKINGGKAISNKCIFSLFTNVDHRFIIFHWKNKLFPTRKKARLRILSLRKHSYLESDDLIDWEFLYFIYIKLAKFCIHLIGATISRHHTNVLLRGRWGRMPPK